MVLSCPLPPVALKMPDVPWVSAPGSAHSAALSDGKDPSAWRGIEHRGEDTGKVGKEKTLQGAGGKPARQASLLLSTWKSKAGSSVSSPVMLS